MNPIALLGVMAQTQEIVEATDLALGNQSMIQLIFGADLIVQIVMVMLFVFSIVSWAIIGSKHRQLKRAKQLSERFYRLFNQSKSIDAILSKGTFRKSPAFNVFKAAVDSLRENQSPQASRMVQREIKRAADEEIESMEYSVPFLATTSSAAPFLGLFGTVWGILHAFWKIGKTGSSSLAVVGPYISEALITTAVGLIAAVPATIFYNFFVNRIRIIAKDLDDFSDDLNLRISHEYYNQE
ncbi:MAG: MotA/TolQ/ExbB proton channel family protein [Proteobacteria bacterium]|nr:MotA/TolQ/ExbB proton channel family protein [Pseudomonadota bacterium]